jgi:trans-aconitate methyltransferase
MDATQISYKNKFDIIFSNATLHWIKDHNSLLRRVRESLKESGRILFQMGGKGNAEDVIEIVNQVIGTKKWKSYFYHFQFPYTFYSPAEYEHLLKEAGFVPNRFELIPKVMAHKGKESMRGWIRTTWLPYTERVPENQRDNFMEDVVNLYLKQHPLDNEGLIPVKMVRLEVEAVIL